FIWFPFSMGITTFAALHGPHIAAGMTRRAFARGTLLAVAVLAVAYAAVMAVLFAVEGVVYEANGWHQVISDDAWFPIPPTNPLVVGLWQLVVTLTAEVSGLLVAAVYQRLGGWWGTLALPLTV